MAQLLKSPDLLTMAYTLGGSKQHGTGVIGQGLYKEVMDDTSLRKNLLATGSKQCIIMGFQMFSSQRH